MRKGEKTRKKIMDLARQSILARGYAGTSIDALVEEAGITKGGFFYHFKDKSELMEQLLLQYFEDDEVFFQSLFDRADELSEDPLHSYLIFMKLLAEEAVDIQKAHPGCIAASVAYQQRSFDRRIFDINRRGVDRWRQMFLARLQAIDEVYERQVDVDLVLIADAMTAIMEGGIILNKVLDNSALLSQQILLHRDFLRLVFAEKKAA